MEEHLDKSVRHVKDKHVAIVNSQEVERLIEALNNDNGLKVHGNQVIAFELGEHLVEVNVRKQKELTEIIDVEWVSEVHPFLLFQLNPFERNEEQLDEEAN